MPGGRQRPPPGAFLIRFDSHLTEPTTTSTTCASGQRAKKASTCRARLNLLSNCSQDSKKRRRFSFHQPSFPRVIMLRRIFRLLEVHRCSSRGKPSVAVLRGAGPPTNSPHAQIVDCPISPGYPLARIVDCLISPGYPNAKSPNLSAIRAILLPRSSNVSAIRALFTQKRLLQKLSDVSGLANVSALQALLLRISQL